MLSERQLALAGVDLEVRQGELLIVLGGNGCGKTTLLRCITRALHPTEGEVWLNGQEISRLGGEKLRRARLDVAMIWQQANLVRRRSVAANVASGALGRHPTWWTAFGGLPPRRCTPRKATRGRWACRDLALSAPVRCLAARRSARRSRVPWRSGPLVMLADEPVASLDPEAAQEIMRLLRNLAHNGHAVLCVLHQVDLAFDYADRVVGMRDGRIAFDQHRAEVSHDQVQRLYLAQAA